MIQSDSLFDPFDEPTKILQCRFCKSLNIKAFKQEWKNGHKHLKIKCLECKKQYHERKEFMTDNMPEIKSNKLNNRIEDLK